MSDWTTPPFTDLPPADGSDCRWVGSTLMNEEQYRMEWWQRTVSGGSDYWRVGSLKGVEEYAALRRLRRADRKTAWKTQQETNEGWSRHIESMVEAAL